MTIAMKLTQLDLNLFVVFDVIYAERNLTRAAEVLSVTQPTVSNALARMRKLFNDPLFVKTSRGMAPTPFAESLAGRVRGAMELLAASAHGREEFNPARSQRTFRLSMNDWFEAMAMPALTQKLLARAPGAYLRSFRSSRSMIARELAAGATDLAIDARLEDTTDLLQQKLHSERYVCALRQGHPLAGKPLTLDGYLGLGHAHVSGRRRGAGHVELALKAIGSRRNVKVRLQHYMSAPDIITTSDLALTLPENLTHSLGLKILDLPFEVPRLDLMLYWHRTLDEDPTNRWLRQLVLELGPFENG